MASKQEVQQYLKELKVKMEIFGILFLDDRGKNQQTLHDLEISPAKRKEIISSLKAEDYSQGPLDEKMHGILPMWVFGKQVKQKEVYIKVSMGIVNHGFTNGIQPWGFITLTKTTLAVLIKPILNGVLITLRIKQLSMATMLLNLSIS
jgi:competence CoiA-like predicted nuclease